MKLNKITMKKYIDDLKKNISLIEKEFDNAEKVYDLPFGGSHVEVFEIDSSRVKAPVDELKTLLSMIR